MEESKFDLEDKLFVYKRKLQNFYDQITPKFHQRWACVAVLLSLFFLRVYIKQGYAVVAYLLGLFYLNHIMLYLSPLEDPSDETLLQSDRERDEYKGFQRKISEFEFWK